MTAGAGAPEGSSPRPLVDTHCHLVLLDGRGLLDEALEGAVAGGVEQVVTVGIGPGDNERNRALAERFAGVFFTAGWHPHEKSAPDARDLATLDELLAHPRAVAVGEVGLDAHWRPGYHEVPMEVQRRSLRAMLELALAHGKPVVVHDRETHTEILDELDRFPGLRAVMHCYSGDAEHARRCLDRGHILSFAGTVTFPRSDGIQAVAREAPADAFVVETDAPFLAPVPFRGRPNQPRYVGATLERVAALRGEPAAALAARTAATARRFFGLPDERIGAAPPGSGR